MTTAPNLPPLPKGTIAADTCPVMWAYSDEQMQSYALAAYAAGRKAAIRDGAMVIYDEGVVDGLCAAAVLCERDGALCTGLDMATLIRNMASDAEDA